MKRTVKSTKSRGGCQRCKAKRMKCDETKPECRICLANGVECPGFAKPLKWSNKHEVFSKPHRRQPQTKSSKFGHREQETEENDEDIRSMSAICSHESRESNQNIGWDANGSLIPSLFDWPNLETCGYEALAFSSDQTGQSFMSGFDASFTYPFFNKLNGHTPSDDSNGNDATPDSTSHLLVFQGSEVVNPSTDSSSRSGNLLQTFYRLSVPSQMPGFSEEDLVSHYFNNVCSIYSCFDSDSNPFRSLVRNLWTNSKTIYLAIQSMSIAHLANFYPYMAPLGLAKRSQAWKSLQQDLQRLRTGERSTNGVLLSLLLLGLSSAWHQASNLGLQYLFIARNLLQSQLQDRRNSRYGETLRNEEFFHNALMHWEMLASFVDPVPIMPFPGLKSPNLAHTGSRSTPTISHPWTGIACETQYALAEIGRILRRQRNATPMLEFSRKLVKEEDEKWAKTLEEFLLAVEIPDPDNIVNYDDSKTPKSDLIRAADAYRFIGLLELYGAFPEMFRETMEDDSALRSLGLTIADNVEYADVVDSWLMDIAIHVLEIIKPISISSAACRLLPILFVAAASQLRLPDANNTVESDQHNIVVEARYIVEARMLVLSRKYPQRPLLQMIDIMKEVWQRLDDGSESAHWMDVAHEKGWQTLMG